MDTNFVYNATLIDRIDAILPQTQCRQCSFQGCRPYAQAMAKGEADINQCPPGGEQVILELARLLGQEPKPLNEAYGRHGPKTVVVIDELLCIGCTLCIQACPVDAILGAAKLMHTVITEECTGCNLCLAPCPVDCIHSIPAPQPLDTTLAKQKSAIARERHRWHLTRLEIRKKHETERKQQASPQKTTATANSRKAAIAAAVQRVQAKKIARAALAAQNAQKKSPAE
ncbi:MAG: electron transport complex subunit RsxB [Gammaproteobacteria bacterium]|nr:electron transport complex subunit RsxB [Gammaproteobacteria bacterium]